MVDIGAAQGLDPELGQDRLLTQAIIEIGGADPRAASGLGSTSV
ncbi:hypothetical protein ACRAWG_28400 [Methylobacterium sp. P31]